MVQGKLRQAKARWMPLFSFKTEFPLMDPPPPPPPMVGLKRCVMTEHPLLDGVSSWSVQPTSPSTHQLAGVHLKAGALDRLESTWKQGALDTGLTMLTSILHHHEGCVRVTLITTKITVIPMVTQHEVC